MRPTSSHYDYTASVTTRGSSQSKGTKDSRRYTHLWKKQNPNTLLGRYILRSFAWDSAPSTPNPPRAVLKAPIRELECASRSRCCRSFALRRGRRLPPTHQDTIPGSPRQQRLLSLLSRRVSMTIDGRSHPSQITGENPKGVRVKPFQLRKRCRCQSHTIFVE